MTNDAAIPIHRSDDGELMGYVQAVDKTWQAQTIFGYTFQTASTEEEASRIVLDEGLGILMEPWEYYNQTTNAWERCIIIEASKHSVTIAPMDGLLPNTAHTHTLTEPFENKLRRP